MFGGAGRLCTVHQHGGRDVIGFGFMAAGKLNAAGNFMSSGVCSSSTGSKAYIEQPQLETPCCQETFIGLQHLLVTAGARQGFGE